MFGLLLSKYDPKLCVKLAVGAMVITLPVLVSAYDPSGWSKTKETPKLIDTIGREQNLGPHEFTLGSGSEL